MSRRRRKDGGEPADQGAVSALVAELAKAESALDTELGDGAEAVVDSLGQTHLLRRAQLALQRSEARFRHVIETLPAAVYTCDARGGITLFNKSAAVLWGREPEPGRDLWCGSWRMFRLDGTAIPPDRSPMAMAILGRPYERGQEIVIERPDGSRSNVLAYPDLLRDPTGVVTGALNMLVDITDQRRSDLRLREREQWLSAIFEQAAVGVSLADAAKGCLIRVNQRFCDIVGYSREELMRLTVTDITHPEDVAADRDLLAGLRAGTVREASREKRYVCKNGDVVWVSLAVSSILGADSKPASFIAVIQDVTESKRAGLALKASEERFRTMLDGVQAGVIVHGADGGIRAFNAKAMELLGVTAEQMAQRVAGGPGWARVRLDGTRLEDSELPYRRAQVTRRPVNDVVLGVDRAARNDRIWLLVSANPILTAEGEVAEVIVTFMDATERIRAEQAVRDNAQFAEDILDSLTAHVAVLDEKGTIIAVNEAWRRFARDGGVVETDFVGRDYFERASMCSGRGCCEQEEAAIAGVRKVLSGAKPYFFLEYSCRFPNERRWYLMRVSPLRGARRGAVVAHQDVTETKEIREQLWHSQKLQALGQLSGGIAHDFNNALAPIILAGPHLRQHLRDPGALRMLDIIEQSSARGAALVRQMLCFVRGTSGEKRNVDVAHVLREVVDIAKTTFPKSIRVEFDLGKDLHHVSCDPTQIHQVALNLCVNARDAMPDGGSLRVAASNRTLDSAAAAGIPDARPGTFVRIDVADTGTGIPPELLEKIWLPFFTTKGEGKGTGLGLSTVRGIVRQHDGFAAVRSVFKGRSGHGTEFSIYLPAIVEGASADEAADPGEDARAGAGELILIVDDEESVGEVAARILVGNGYRTITARDGADAIAAFVPKADEVRLVLTDLEMPVLGGKALAAAIHRLKPKLRIVAMSGADRQSVNPGDGFSGEFLSKPFGPASLLSAVRRSLDLDKESSAAVPK